MVLRPFQTYFNKHDQTIWTICAVIVYAIPLVFFLNKIYLGTFPFWFDPARDMLLAIENIKKVGLIGPPSGIPGIFYGPYWIWLLSIGIMISRDPRVAITTVGIIPYFTLFPFLLIRLRNILGRYSILLLWLLFMLGFNHYATNLWNPHLAPLIFLGIITLTTFLDLSTITRSKILNLILLGFLAGFLVNFHISFGIGVLSGLILYLSFLLVSNRQTLLKKAEWYNALLLYGSFGFGVLIAFIPFILFETRHNYLQTQTIIHTLAQAFLHNAPVVGLKGLSKSDIIFNFFNSVSKIFKIPDMLGIILAGFFFVYSFFTIYKRKFIPTEFRMAASLICIAVGILLVYLSSKNPVWEYHFFGVEILMLLLFALLTKKDRVLTYLFFVLSLGSIFYQMYGYVRSFGVDPTIYTSSYASTKKIVEFIYQDASNKSFTTYAYSPSIYTFEYDYMFKWYKEMHHNESPKNDTKTAEYIYLILPPVKSEIQKDFIEYKTPAVLYQTTLIKIFPDKTQVLRRILIN